MYSDLEHGREQRRKQAARRRAEKPALVRQQRRESARRRRAIDPLRGMSQEDFRAAARKYASARRARAREAFIEHVDPRVVYEIYGGRCGICNGFIEGDFHVDHVRPLAKGGLHGYVNTQPAHPKCNLEKSASWLTATD